MLEGYRRLPCPHLLPGKSEDKKDKKDKKESEKHKNEGSGDGGSRISQELQMVFNVIHLLSSSFIFFHYF